MGDIGMLKGGLLAWKLCCKGRSVVNVADHRGGIGLGVYWREEGGETLGYKSRLCIRLGAIGTTIVAKPNARTREKEWAISG